MPARPVPYADILAAARESGEGVEAFLREELPLCWQDRYLAMAQRPSRIVVFRYGTFDYLFDSFQEPGRFDPVNGDGGNGGAPVEARLVAAIGTSAPRPHAPRDDGRLRGLTLSAMPGSGPGSPWDRGHFIAHAIGGTVDGNEANVFLQLRSVNRGRYRSMERYCQQHRGVLCFSRPLYADTSAHPVQIEFGVLRSDGTLWVELLPNRDAEREQPSRPTPNDPAQPASA